MTNKKHDIILFTLFRTDHEYSSVSLSWAKEFAKNNRVFYINHPYSIKDFLKSLGNPRVRRRAMDLIFGRITVEKNKSIPNNFVSVTPGLSLPINWLSPGPIYDFFKKWNDKVVLKAIKKTIKKYNVQDFIYLNCYDPYFVGNLPKNFGAKLSIYQCIDDISQDPYSVKHGKRLEEEAIAKSDLALVTSTQLKKILEVNNPNTFVAHNAVDISIFEHTVSMETERPIEIADVKTKIIGFTGNLDYLRINYPLLKKIALRHHDKTLVLVGPINSQEYYDVGLDKMPNVISTGGKKISELPNYLKFMDCTIIPFLCNTLTESIYPLKINEYLAAGSAIVSTSFSNDIRSFGDVLYLAEDEEHFLSLIDTAIEQNSSALITKRQNVAQENTWEARVRQFWSIVDKFLN